MTVKEIETEIRLIVKRYEKYGVNYELVNELVSSGMNSGFSVHAALAGVRLGLSIEYGEHEYFTLQEIAESLGVSETDVMQYIKENETELREIGGLAEIQMAP
ncbi:MAG: hypothetical protein Q4D42_12925 [Eubacteriales bacterium]|nr:hypothetical protein [Eubacteriales bacterium]